MSVLTIGSLFTGVGGLDLAVESFFDGRLSWVSENEPALVRLLEAHWPGVMNLGDMTTVDWSLVPRVDVLVGGSPCQDVSLSGRQAGFAPGTRSNLWVAMRDAIAVLRPRIVVWENVRGALNARAVSDVESDPGLLGVSSDGPALRALGRVLGDLSQLGFNAEWAGVRASDVGAPHRRFRLFVVAYNPGVRRDFRPVAEQEGARVRPADGRALPGHPAGQGLEGWPLRGEGPAKRPAAPDGLVDWGEYGPAIRQWEHILGRPAPVPLEHGRLSARFSEWMMGMPEGWVTAPELGLNRREQLTACGNAVVSLQAQHALELLWDRIEEAA